MNIGEVVKFIPKYQKEQYTVAVIIDHFKDNEYVLKTISTPLNTVEFSRSELMKESWVYNFSGTGFDIEIIGTKETTPEYFL